MPSAKSVIPNFDIMYATCPIVAPFVIGGDMLITAPPPRAIIDGRSARAARNDARAFTCMTRSNRVAGVASTGRQ
jgi:hypothetical protein